MHETNDRLGDVIAAATEILKEDIISDLANLVRVPSVTGAEGLITKTLTDWADSYNVPWQLDYCEPELHNQFQSLSEESNLESRPNVILTLPADRPTQPPVVLNGHIDVVPAGDGWTIDPFGAEIRSGRMYGRGTVDMKGGIASALGAIRILRAAKISLPFDLRLECVIAEESGGLGTLVRLSRDSPVGAVINLEPTEARIAAACGGNIAVRIEVTGAASHTSVPHEGVNAIDKLLQIREGLMEFFEQRRQMVKDPLFQELKDPLPGVVSVFKSGDWWATVPDKGFLEARIGVMVGETVDECRNETIKLIEDISRNDPWFSKYPPKITMIHEGFPAWKADTQHPLLRALSEGAAAAGLKPSPTAITYGNDGSHYAGRGYPTFIFGPGSIVQAHQPDESVDIDEVVAVAKALAYALNWYANGDKEL